MPFRDQEWEELQRGCDIFPAYSDYVLGPDSRLLVTQEPGLHPLIYRMLTPEQIQCTRNVQSQSHSRQKSNRSEPSNSAITRHHAGSYEEAPSGNLGYDNNSGKSALGGDRIPQIKASNDPSHSPRGLRSVLEKYNESRQKIHQQRDHKQLPSTLQRNVNPTPVKVKKQQSWTGNWMEYSDTVIRQSPQHLPLAPMSPISTQSVSLPSPRLSSLLELTKIFVQQFSATPKHRGTLHFPDRDPQFIMLHPDDMVHNPRFLCIGHEKCEQIRRCLSELWQIANNAMDTSERNEALANIGSFSMTIVDQIKRIEISTMQNSHFQEMTDIQASQGQQRQALSQQEADQVPYLQERLQNMQVYHQPQLISAAVSAEQPLSYPSQLESPSAQQAPVLPNIGVAIPQASAQLRANINRFIPTVWYCLLLINHTSGPMTEDILQKRQRAQQWINSFKTSLPVEGLNYTWQVLRWMRAEQKAGRDPLVSIGYRA
jgi:hypothetical protein